MTEPSGAAPVVPDSRDGAAYVIDPEVSFAVRVAEATGRPLLLRGEPGCGKSSLAAYVAREKGWRYYEHVVTSRTTARDLLWSFDAVRRLADAQVRTPGAALHDVNYVQPGVLWWAFAPELARRRGAPEEDTGFVPAEDPDPRNAERAPDKAVVLIDEVDKADPDLPNGMLVPLGSNEFEVTETGARVRHRGGGVQHLIMITTNEERELPQAFLRRCVVVWVPEPTEQHLVQVAERHLRYHGAAFGRAERELAEELAGDLLDARVEAQAGGIRPPSTAEYLDAFQAMRELDIGLGSPEWGRLRGLTLLKVQQPKA